MIVDVVELRRRGVRIASDEALRAAPVRGRLQLTPCQPAWRRDKARAPLMALLVAPGACEHVLEPLDRARVVEIGFKGLLIIGMQELGRGRRLTAYRQAWWARPVPESGESANSEPGRGRSERAAG